MAQILANIEVGAFVVEPLARAELRNRVYVRPAVRPLGRTFNSRLGLAGHVEDGSWRTYQDGSGTHRGSRSRTHGASCFAGVGKAWSWYSRAVEFLWPSKRTIWIAGAVYLAFVIWIVLTGHQVINAPYTGDVP